VAPGEFSRLCDKDRGWVYPDDFVNSGQVGENPCHCSSAATDIERDRCIRKLQFRQIGVEHGSLLKIHGAEFKHLGQSRLQRLVSLSDGSIRIWHCSSVCSNACVGPYGDSLPKRHFASKVKQYRPSGCRQNGESAVTSPTPCYQPEKRRGCSPRSNGKDQGGRRGPRFRAGTVGARLPR